MFPFSACRGGLAHIVCLLLALHSAGLDLDRQAKRAGSSSGGSGNSSGGSGNSSRSGSGSGVTIAGNAACADATRFKDEIRGGRAVSCSSASRSHRKSHGVWEPRQRNLVCHVASN